MRDMLEARKRGDLAFRDKDFKTAIDCYSQVCAMSSVMYVQYANYWESGIHHEFCRIKF